MEGIQVLLLSAHHLQDNEIMTLLMVCKGMLDLLMSHGITCKNADWCKSEEIRLKSLRMELVRWFDPVFDRSVEGKPYHELSIRKKWILSGLRKLPFRLPPDWHSSFTPNLTSITILDNMPTGCFPHVRKVEVHREFNFSPTMFPNVEEMKIVSVIKIIPTSCYPSVRRLELRVWTLNILPMERWPVMFPNLVELYLQHDYEGDIPIFPKLTHLCCSGIPNNVRQLPCLERILVWDRRYIYRPRLEWDWQFDHRWEWVWDAKESKLESNSQVKRRVTDLIKLGHLPGLKKLVLRRKVNWPEGDLPYRELEIHFEISGYSFPRRVPNLRVLRYAGIRGMVDPETFIRGIVPAGCRIERI